MTKPLSAQTGLKPIFIGGTGRSGTSILKKVLLKHPNIVGFDQELRIITDPDGVLSVINNISNTWSPYVGDMSLQRFEAVIKSVGRATPGHRVLARLCDLAGISPPHYLGMELDTALTGTNVADAFRPVLDALVPYRGKGRWIGSRPGRWPTQVYETSEQKRAQLMELFRGAILELYLNLDCNGDRKALVEDTPFNILHADQILELFPDMLLIHMYRDPMDVIASYQTKNWGGDSALIAAKRIRNILRRWNTVKSRFPADQLIEVSLEDLSETPHETLANMLGRVGLQYETQMDAIKLNKVNAGRWMAEISDHDAKEIKTILADV